MVSNRNLLFQGSIFRCYVSFRDGNLCFQTCSSGFLKSEARSSIGRELWGAKKFANLIFQLGENLPQFLLEFAPFAVQKIGWTSPWNYHMVLACSCLFCSFRFLKGALKAILSPKSLQATPFRFPLKVIRSELEAFTSKASRRRK